MIFRDNLLRFTLLYNCLYDSSSDYCLLIPGKQSGALNPYILNIFSLWKLVIILLRETALGNSLETSTKRALFTGQIVGWYLRGAKKEASASFVSQNVKPADIV